MTFALAMIAALMLASAALAMSLRNLIYSALLLILTWAGVASFYLWADAQFVAFAQLLIYVGAVSMIVLFAVLLTNRSPVLPLVAPGSRRRAIGGILAGAAVAAVLAGAVVSTSFESTPGRAPEVSVRQLGFQLMNSHAASLLAVAVILTVALIGATILASADKPEDRAQPSREPLGGDDLNRRATDAMPVVEEETQP
jgi:NADH:ubiquinone oxidoreductase subunit 6 (subunit J)